MCIQHMHTAYALAFGRLDRFLIQCLSKMLITLRKSLTKLVFLRKDGHADIEEIFGKKKALEHN